MRGRVTLLLLSSLLLSAEAVPQCNYRLEYSAGVRSTYFDLVIDGDDLWTATGYGVQLLDRRSDPPRLIAFVAVPGITRTIDVRSGIAYAGSGNAIYVIRRVGNALEIVSGNDVAATVNDVIATSGALFVGTANGLIAFDRRDPLNLASAVVLPTSSSNIQSLARNGENEVLVADGDATVERFNVSSASATPAGSFPGLDRSLAVSVAGQRIFISDTQQTRILTAAGALDGIAPISALSVVPLEGDRFFVAGNDRRFRAVDIRLAAQPVELFAADIIPTGGTVDRIGAMAIGGDRLYVAGGDAGLITLDVTGFRPPYPLRRQTFGPLTSLADGGTSVFASNGLGGLTEFTRFSSGLLAAGATWGSESTHEIRDFKNDILLSSSGATVRFWSTRPVPTMLQAVPVPGAVKAAVLEPNGAALAILEDGSVFRLSVQGTAAAVAVPAAHFIGRSDRGIALAEVNADGTTTIRFYANGNLAAAPVTASVAGAATAMAIDASRVAVFTFRGITVVDFSSSAPAEGLLPASNTSLVRDLAIAGDKVLDVTQSMLRVWDVAQRRLIRTFALPAEALSLSLHPSAATATVLHADGITTIDYQSATPQPALLAVSGPNRYPKKAAAAGDRLFVFDGQMIEVYSTAFSAAPRHEASVRVPGALDFAVSTSLLFVLFSNGGVTAYTHAGTPLRSVTIDEGTDMVPDRIFTAGGAPWVSILRGCISTGCEKKTIVLDPASLVRTASLDGGMEDLAVSGAFAYALTDTLASTDLRAYAISDPLHPALVASRPAEGSAAAVAVAGSDIYTLGTRVFAYNSSLAKAGEFIPPAPLNAATDIAIDEGCAIVTGRSVAAQLFTRSNWSPAGLLSLPGSARGIVAVGGKVIVLTDYSVEVWSRLPERPPAKRRAAP